MKNFYLASMVACLLVFSNTSWADKPDKKDNEKHLYDKTPPAPKTTKEEDQQEINMYEVNQTVLKLSIQSDVSIDDAIDSMKAKAAELNMKMVGHQQVSKELNARGIKTHRLEILQFCNPEDAVKMVEFNPIYAAYMPCRISVLEDANGKNWLLMLNLDMIINEFPLPDELQAIAITINGIMLEIVTAGSTGDF